eukprot:TRINITY_DN32209_c0_g1_i1.p2 TRINITY_DN32209_c0_g1~~TRINITY_DN32209_c0_g1_i1.p2  ORF type:complete len:189 (-),score=9.76 TRINITY_DN32209_c0_g1_i1:301-867(-)
MQSLAHLVKEQCPKCLVLLRFRNEHIQAHLFPAHQVAEQRPFCFLVAPLHEVHHPAHLVAEQRQHCLVAIHLYEDKFPAHLAADRVPAHLVSVCLRSGQLRALLGACFREEHLMVLMTDRLGVGIRKLFRALLLHYFSLKQRRRPPRPLLPFNREELPPLLFRPSQLQLHRQARLLGTGPGTGPHYTL